MKSSLIPGAAFAAGLLACGAGLAQSGAMRPPMVPQAIEMHLQQQRTLEQREAIAAKAAAPESAPAQPAPKKRAAKKSGKAKKKAPTAASG